MKSLIFLILFSFSFVLAYECDTGELRRLKPSDFTPASSKKYSDEYNKVFEEQEKSISNIQRFVPVGEEPRKYYFETRLGKGTLKQLGKIRDDFQYNSVAQYLFDDEVNNTFPEHYTHYYIVGSKGFYLNRGRLIAVLDKRSEKEYLLTRLNSSCQPFEAVSFGTLNHEEETRLRYKITPALCKMIAPQNNKLPSADTLESLESFVREPTDRVTRNGIARDCDLLKQSPAKTPKRTASK